MEPISGFFSLPGETGPDGPEALELISARPGGWTEIWRGTRHGRFRVWKCLQAEFRGRPLYEQMLKKEFRIGYSLRHNHIVEYYDYTDTPGLGHCIEMEWVDGVPLSDALIADRRKVALQICDAVAYLHARQVIHKDLKPANILVTHNGSNIKLIDFGLSDADDTLLRTKAGTEGYAAPELKDGGSFDARTDIYALGKVLGELGFSRIARRCTAARPEKRPDIEAVRKTLDRRFPWGWIVAALLLVTAITALLLLPKTETPSPTPAMTEPLIEEVFSDSLPEVRIPVVEPVSTPKKEAIPATPATQQNDSAADREALEELFRQATELFEQ